MGCAARAVGGGQQARRGDQLGPEQKRRDDGEGVGFLYVGKAAMWR